MAGQIKQNGYSDEKFQVYNNTFVRDGYEFVCWNTKKDGTGSNINPNDYIDCQTDTTLYAQWKLLYKYMQLERSGNLTIANNTTQFGSGSFEYTPLNIEWTTGNSFEFVFKIKTPSADRTDTQVIFSMNSSNNDENFSLVLLNFSLVFNLTGAKSTLTLNSNTDYYIKFNKNATSYTVSISTTGLNYTNVITTSSSITCANAPLYIGRNYSIRYVVSVQYPVQEPVYSTRTGRWVHTCVTGRWFGWHVGWSGHGYYLTERYISSYKTVYHTKAEERWNNANNFAGTIDFNESYLVLNNLKYKLKA